MRREPFYATGSSALNLVVNIGAGNFNIEVPWSIIEAVIEAGAFLRYGELWPESSAQ